MHRDLLAAHTLGGQDQGEPVVDREGGQRGIERPMLLPAQGDRFGPVGHVPCHEAGREAPDHRDTTQATDDEVGACPVQPAPDVVREASALALGEESEEGLLGDVCGQLGIEGRAQANP